MSETAFQDYLIEVWAFEWAKRPKVAKTPSSPWLTDFVGCRLMEHPRKEYWGELERNVCVETIY